MDELARRTLETQSNMLLLEWYKATYGPFRATSGGELLEMVEAAKIVETNAAETTKKWVLLARAAGLSYSDLAVTLGTTKQSVTKKYPAEKTAPPEQRPGYTIRETSLLHHDFVLDQEGRRGRRLESVGACYLVFAQTANQWEYHRASTSSEARLLTGIRNAGYLPICEFGPFTYYGRELAAAAKTGAPYTLVDQQADVPLTPDRLVAHLAATEIDQVRNP